MHNCAWYTSFLYCGDIVFFILYNAGIVFPFCFIIVSTYATHFKLFCIFRLKYLVSVTSFSFSVSKFMFKSRFIFFIFQCHVHYLQLCRLSRLSKHHPSSNHAISIGCIGYHISPASCNSKIRPTDIHFQFCLHLLFLNYYLCRYVSINCQPLWYTCTVDFFYQFLHWYWVKSFLNVFEKQLYWIFAWPRLFQYFT